jgi:carbamoyltransferase
LYTRRALDAGLEGQYGGRYVFLEHHESHAASAFLPSPFEEAAIVTMDGVGEWATGSIARGSGNQVRMLQEMRFPHSLGLLYSAFTYFTGFKVNSGEYKLMGLAPYGEPRFRDTMLEHLIDLKDDGSFRMDMSYFPYTHRAVMTSAKLDGLLGGPPRRPETPITQREMDIAASIQEVTEEIMLRTARHAHALTGSRNLALAGGVALNCVGNGRILREGPFEQVWIQPAAGDAGGALGSALFVWHQLLGNERVPEPADGQAGSLLGPAYGPEEIREFLDGQGAVYRWIDSEEKLAREVAQLIDEQKVVGHFAGRMEFGPRSLGARSILGDARSTRMQSLMNRKIKFRESFRPFAPSVLREDADEFFELGPDHESPYMLLVADVREEKRTSGPRVATGFDQLHEIRSEVPAITHVDNSARVQTVDAERSPRFAAILREFKARTGCPVVINTSFNVRGEPIVNTPADAYNCFMHTNMDALVLENYVLRKSEQPDAHEIDVDAYLSEFALD